MINLDPECELLTYDISTASNTVPVQDFTNQATAALCLRLTECCGEGDLVRYMNALIYGSEFTEFTTSLCQEHFGALFEDYFAQWIERALAGQVKYDSDQAQAYLNHLSTLACDEIPFNQAYLTSNVLFETSQASQVFQYQTSCLRGPCIGLPSNGYGSCDPQKAFCCVRQEDQSCALAEVGQVGECVAVSKLEEACSPRAQLCQGDVECSYFYSSDDYRCMTPSQYSIQVGMDCDEEILVYDNCADNSYCDFEREDPICTLFKEDGEACTDSLECIITCVEQVCTALCQ